MQVSQNYILQKKKKPILKMFYRSTASYELVTWPKDTFHRRGDVSAECRRTS